MKMYRIGRIRGVVYQNHWMSMHRIPPLPLWAGFLVRHSPRRLLGMAAEEAASTDRTDRGVA